MVGGFVTSFVGSLIQQKFDNRTKEIDWTKALEAGLYGAISSLYSGTPGKSGNL